MRAGAHARVHVRGLIESVLRMHYCCTDTYECVHNMMYAYIIVVRIHITHSHNAVGILTAYIRGTYAYIPHNSKNDA